MKNNLLDEQYISNLPQAIVQNLQWQSQYIVSLICERIRDIGQLSPSDAHRLSAAYYAGADIKKINREIARITGLNISEIDKIYKETGEENAAFAKTLYDFRNVPYVPYAENKKMQSIIRAAAETTKDEYINLSRTAGFVSRDGTPRTIRQQYMNAIDRAISNVATGSTDYQSEMQATIKEMANSGYRTISYENGHSRRMDTAVRQNILTGIKDITQQIQRQVGQELSTDGYEISYHANPRPSHAAMGGTQYTKEQFVAQGIDKLLADYNCRHIAFDIIVGVTEPNFSCEELAEMKARDSEPREWQGEPISGYKATQKQRIYEAKIRKLKDEAMAFSHTGDTLRQMQAQRKINEIGAEYARFSKAVRLPVKDNRTSVAGFRGVRTEGLARQANALYNKGNEVREVIISERTSKGINIGNQEKHIKGTNGYIVGRSYINGDLNTAQELVNKYHGMGEIKFNSKGEWTKKEFVSVEENIGYVVEQFTGNETETNRFAIHYGKNGTHIVPAKRKD